MSEQVTPAHRRLLLPGFLSQEQCEELEFIHKSNSTVGYHPGVFCTSLTNLITSDCAHYIVPFILIREQFKEKVEEFFHCEFELFIEFTGMISWTTGSSIGWHSDDNRPYLKQRNFSAVCYLNTYDKNFKGGLFHFADGEPSTVTPNAGDALIYTSDETSTHSVDEILGGERLTLTLWFTKDNTHDEDAKLLSHLKNSLHPTLPIPETMYWVSDKHDSSELGFDLRYARLHVLGIDAYRSKESWFLVCNDELFETPFSSILHLSQALHFYKWKGKGVKEDCERSKINNVLKVKQSQKEQISGIKNVLLKDRELLGQVFGDMSLSCIDQNNPSFDWMEFSSALVEFEEYSCKLREILAKCLPLWESNAILFHVE